MLFLCILSYTEQSLNPKIKESPGTLMKKRKVCVLLILIVVFVLAVGWKRTDPEVRCTSARAIAENIAGQGMICLVEQSMEHPKAALTFDDGPDARYTGALLDGLRARKYDLIFASRPAEGANLVSVAVSQQDLVLIVPKNHPLAAQHVIDLAETLPYPQVCFSKGSGMRDIVDELFQKLGAAPRIAYETQEDQVVAGLVAHGFGIAVVPYMDLLLKLEVKILQIARPAWERELCLTYDDSGYLPPAARSFREFVLQTSRASE